MSVHGFQVGNNVEQYDYNYLDNLPTIPADADDVGAIAAPASPTEGQFLVYTNGAWTAVTVPDANGEDF